MIRNKFRVSDQGFDRVSDGVPGGFPTQTSVPDRVLDVVFWK